MSSISKALEHHQAGRLDDAQRLYHEVLERAPDHPDALHLLGVIAHQRGDAAQAIALIERAISGRASAPMYSNLGLALKAAGQLSEAVNAFHRALALAPTDAVSCANLANVLRALGNLDEAVTWCERALAINPVMAEAHNNLALALTALGRLDEAEASCLKALAQRPRYADGYFNLGMLQQLKNRMDEALASYAQALSINPDFVGARFAAATIYQGQGRYDAAIAQYTAVLRCQPGHKEALHNLGLVLHTQAKVDDAIACYRQALLVDPDYLSVLNNLGNALVEKGDDEGASACYRRILCIDPANATACCNLGIALKNIGDLSGACEYYHRAITLNPDYSQAYCNLGVLQKDQGKHPEAVASFRQALALRPDDFDAHSNLLFTLSQSPACPAADYLEEARRYGAAVQEKVRPYLTWPSVQGRPHRARLRVGFVSGDLKNHPVGFFMEGVLAHLDPTRLDLVAYASSSFNDTMTDRLRPRFSSWRTIAGLRDDAAAKLIHDDQIDILIDLAGHTAHNRLPLFAWKSAPVQVSWLGYFASTGVPEIDYLLADAYSVPDTQRASFTERVWCLPDSRLCFTPPPAADRLPVTALPALANGHVTFGSYQNLAKVSDEVLALWGRVMQAVPHSRLRLQIKQLKDDALRHELRQRLARAGIETDRVSMENPVRREPYLHSHGQIDMILDSFPFPGGTTTCEALWMGVPTLTLAGQTLLSRQGASLLSCAGLGGWIAEDAQDYVGKSVTFATDLAALAQLRQHLRPQLLASPLCDAARFARNLEAALHGMWHDKLGGAE